MNRFCKAVAAVGIALFSFTGTARADECHLSWDIPCCAVPGTDMGTAVVTLTICNCSNEITDYTWDFPPQPPLLFSPPAGMVTLGPGECVDIPITVTCPADFVTPGNGVTFTVLIANGTTVTSFKCVGSIRNSGDVKATPTPPVITVSTTGPIYVGVLVTNTSDTPILWDPTVEVMPQTGEIVAAPFEPVMLAPRSSMHKTFRVNRFELARGFPADSFFDVVIKWDQDGDGVQEAGSSAAIHTVRADPCAADLNGDGVINGGDLAILLASWGPCF